MVTHRPFARLQEVIEARAGARCRIAPRSPGWSIPPQPLPPGVQRQFTIQQIISEEMESAITGQKPIDAALADAERRVNDVLFNLL